MSPERDDARQAYEVIRQQIVTLALPPGSPIDEKRLAATLELNVSAVSEALRRLAHDRLVDITPRQEYGTYVTNVSLADLDQIHETRLLLEVQGARLAAGRATPEDLDGLEVLRGEHAALPSVAAGDSRALLDLDHRVHRAIAAAAHNTYLADALEHFFGLSQRLWFVALPRLGSLMPAVDEHLGLIDAVRAGDADRAAEAMQQHVEGFYRQVRATLVARVQVSYGSDERTAVVDDNSILAGAIISTGLPLEQPCAGRGTCHKCKVIAQGALSPLDEREMDGLTEAERKASYRLACRARVVGDATVTLAPIIVYSNKMFQACDDYKQPGVPLGLAVDLGSTTVAAFVTTLDEGRVCAGAAALNQQTAFGADVISRMAAALQGTETAERLSMLAQSSIVQAMDALKLSPAVRKRIEKVTVVCNCAMHHLLLRYPVTSLAMIPFQPHSTAAVRSSVALHDGILGDIFPPGTQVALPPLIGGFVGSDALACLAYYGFDRATGPMAAIDLGTNGEVMVTDGKRILVASTAAGPAFEGVNISCGTRAVDGAIVSVRVGAGEGEVSLTTIGDKPPVGLTGSGLLRLVLELRRAGVVDGTGRMAREHAVWGRRLELDERGVRRFLITADGVNRRGVQDDEEGTRISLYLTQHDVREVQKAKGAIRAAIEILMSRLGLGAGDLQRLILTGSFGSQLDVESVVRLGMVPPVDLDIVEPSANGAGFGAALFLDDEEFARGERIAAAAEQVDLDMDADFNRRYVEGMELPAGE